MPASPPGPAPGRPGIAGPPVVGDEAELLPLCERLVKEHPKQAASVRAGKTAVLGFFVGQVMKETRGNADPKLVSELFRKLLADVG
jgi:glutaminyl-tRNA synthetase